MQASNFLDFQFEFITSVLGLERNQEKRAINLSGLCVGVSGGGGPLTIHESTMGSISRLNT